MLAEYRKAKGLIDSVLFLKWDRFSRNAGDSYAMLATLQKLGIGAQAIEQPLDLSVPENKMMLAIYLAMPEVENLRRGLNVKTGTIRARKKVGTWEQRQSAMLTKSMKRVESILPQNILTLM